MKLSIIVAVAENYAIGKDNDLLWHISEDLKRFKRITQGRTLLMGRNTWFSLPIRPLPKRRHIVLTDENNLDGYNGAETASSVEEALKLCASEEEVFIIGGGSVYKQLMPFAEKMYITRVLESFEADVFFPEINDDDWQLVDNSSVLKDVNNGLQYVYQTYIRKEKS